MMLQDNHTIHILIALEDEPTKGKVTEAISSNYHLISFEAAMADNHIPDICIVDLTRWNDLDYWVKNRHPNELYRLLVVGEDELNKLPIEIRDLVNDIIITPLRNSELQLRLRNIVQMRENAKQMQWIYRRLSTTNRALESTSDAILIADADEVTVYVNPAFKKLFGYDVEQLSENNLINVLFEEPSIGRQIFRRIRQNGSWSGEVDLRTSNDSLLPFLFNIDHILDEHDDPIGFIMIFTDITLHKIVSTIQAEQRIQAEAQLDTARALSSTLDLSTVFDRMLDNINRVVPNDAANVIIIEGDHVKMVDRNDYSKHDVIEKLQKGEGDVSEFDDLRRILQTDRSLIIPDTEQYLEEYDDMQSHSPWLKSHMGIPIRLQDEIIGFLNVDSMQPGLFQPIHAERLQIFVEQAAIAIHNARLHENAKKLAMLEERHRLARDLHDAVSQILFSASIIAEALPALWDRDPEAIPPRLDQIHRLTRGALAEMRSLLIELNPDRFLETDVDVLMEQLRDGVLGQAHADVTLNIEQNLELSAHTKIAIYYITQEALNNIVKHAQATHIVIKLTKLDDRLELLVHDNGQGFDAQSIASTSFGLDNMRERAEASDANLTITSEVGEGTTISVTWLV